MKTYLKIAVALASVFAVVCALFAWSFIATWRKLPEAYAAWDIGTILVCFMERNNDRWPKDWDEIAASIRPDDNCITLRGVRDGDDRQNGYPKTLERIKTLVKIDWSHTPVAGKMAYPVTTIAGDKFTVVWGNSEPNEMVYAWITNHQKDPNF
jgi:hypothetical protein